MLLLFFFLKYFSDFIQPQHIWPYIQHNFIHHTHFPHPAFLTNNGNNCQPQTTPSPGSTISDSDNHPNCLQQHNNGNQGDINNEDSRLQGREKQIQIAKPLPSRPTPFLHHSLNHPHLHSLLAHCRNPYIGGIKSNNLM